MSRLTKLAPPGCHPTQVEGGYEICARCGEILCIGESVEVVYRGDRGNWRWYAEPLYRYIRFSGPDWCGIYTHPEGKSCGHGNASGWQAVERAIDRREFNRATCREAQSVVLWGSVRPFVSLLDNRQIELESKSVDYYQEENPESQLRRKWSQEGEEDEKPFLIEYDIKFAHQSSRVGENSYIRLLDCSMLGRWAIVSRRVTETARKALYVTRSRHWFGHTAPFDFYFPGRDKRYVLEERLGNVTREVGGRDGATLQRITQGSALSKDNGEAVEYALYSRWSVVSTGKGRAFPYPPPLAKVPADADYDAERDALTRIARRAGVSEKNIGKALEDPSNEHLAEEIGKSDKKREKGKKGELPKGKEVDELAVYRFSPRPPQRVPLPFDSKQFPERYHWKVPQTDFRCPHCSMTLELASAYCPHCGERTTLEERAKAVIDSAARDLTKDLTSLYESCGKLRTAFLRALNDNFLASSRTSASETASSTPLPEKASFVSQTCGK